jgi:hypothetical protein
MIRQRKKSLVFLLMMLLGLAAAPVHGQKSDEKLDTATIDKIKEEGMKHSRVMETLSYLTDVYGPRLTGSPNVKAAEEWAQKQMREWGLQNVHLEPWGPFGRGWSLEGFSANVTSPQFIPLMAFPKAWSPSTKGSVHGEPVYLGAKDPADLEKYRGKLKGAIVLIDDAQEVKAHFDPQGVRLTEANLLEMANADMPGRGGAGNRGRFQMTPEQRARQELATKKWQLCFEEGAAVVLEPGRGDGGTIFVQQVTIPAAPDTPFDRRPRPWAKDAPAIVPQVSVAVEHYNRMIRMIQKGAHVALDINIQSRFYDDDPMQYDVIAEIPGTDLKDQVVMVGGHFDSWHSGTGATDNGAGSAVAMEAIRILQSLGIKPRRTIRIGLWTGEEEGLLGSRGYVDAHFGKRIDPERRGPGGPGGAGGPGGPGGADQANAAPPRFELKAEQAKVSGYFNLDNGTGKIRGVYLQGNDAIAALFREWLKPFRDMGAATLSLENTGGTDHLSFDAVGIPGFQFIQDPIEYGSRTHHSNMDVYDRIQEEDMKQAATIIAAFVYNTAMRDEQLPRKPLPGQVAAPAAGR